ncbi:hypothetical protein [Sphingobacterium sp.]|uniref:hypothetical protein n=1 Tax=Sphingobacterium sp. TaxID=341027 RepID=UPI002FDD00FD
MIKNRKRARYMVSVACLLLAITACKKDIDAVIPGNGEALKINYIANSDVLRHYKIGGIGIFVDTIPHLNTGNFPFFDLTSAPQKLEYPNFFSTVSGLLYANYLSGQHRFKYNYMIPDSLSGSFGSKPDKMLIDTALILEKDAGSLLYLIDGPIATENDTPTFKIMVIPANRALKLDSTQVAITISHQSPDTEKISCSRITSNGELSRENLPQDLAYGQSTPYLIFAVKDASNGILGLRIYSKSNGKELINTGIPANGEHAYVLAISGFQNEQHRLLPLKLNSDHTVQYDKATIFPNLRASTRQIW